MKLSMRIFWLIPFLACLMGMPVAAQAEDRDLARWAEEEVGDKHGQEG